MVGKPFPSLMSGPLGTLILAAWIACASSHAVESNPGQHETPLSASTRDGKSLALYDESHALLIGSSSYRWWPALTTIPAELDDLEEALTEKNFSVTRLVDPDTDSLREGIRSFIDEHGYVPGNRLLIYFSGHGHSIGDKGFLIPVDAPLPGKPGFRSHTLPMSQVLAWAGDMEAKHVLFMFDSCFAGTVFKSRNLPADKERYIRSVTAKPVRQFIAAGSADQTVPAKSTFTPALIDAIRGKGDLNDDGYVTGSELGLHLAQLLPRYVANQTPQYGTISDYDLSQGDFVFFLNKKPSEKEPTPNDSMAFSVESVLWMSTEKEDSAFAYASFLDQFPDGVFAKLARARLQRLTVPQGEGSTTDGEKEPEPDLEPPPLPPPRTDEFVLSEVAATDVDTIRRLVCSRDGSVDADEIKREASAVFFGRFDYAGASDEARGWGLYLEAIAHCSTSALVEIAQALERKKDCGMALEYARIAVDNGHLGARRLVSQIERKRHRSCKS